MDIQELITAYQVRTSANWKQKNVQRVAQATQEYQKIQEYQKNVPRVE